MAAKTLVNPSYGVEGQYRMLTGLIKDMSQGDYLDTNLTTIYSVQLTARGMCSSMLGAMWVSAGGSGRVTFVAYPSPTEALPLSVIILGQ